MRHVTLLHQPQKCDPSCARYRSLEKRKKTGAEGKLYAGELFRKVVHGG